MKFTNRYFGEIHIFGKFLLFTSLLVSGALFITACTNGNELPVPTKIPTSLLTSAPSDTLNPIISSTQPPSFTQTLPISTVISQTVVIPMEVATPTQINWDGNNYFAYIKNSHDDSVHDNGLYIANTTGISIINVFDGLPGLRGAFFSWSPKGSWLVFSEYDQEKIDHTTLKTNFEPLSKNLWIVKPNGSERHFLTTIKNELSIHWSSDEEKFFFNCSIGQSDNGICVVYPKSGETVFTGNFGLSPQPSPDGKVYAFIKDEREIYISVEGDSDVDLIFSSETGNIPGYSWSNDQRFIITAVVNKFGCGNLLDGSTTFLRVNVDNLEVEVLRIVNWSIYGWDLSLDQNLLLTNWFLCVGNAYGLDGVIGLNNDLITWNLDRWTDHEWTQDGRYLIGKDIFSGQLSFIDPSTGKKIGFLNPFFLNSLLTEDEKSLFFIQWIPQPITAGDNK